MNSSFITCNAETVEKVKQHARLLTLFLKETSFLTEAYILDYFVQELWTCLPTKWLEVTSQFDIHDLECFLNHEKNVRYRQPWPLSLLSFRASAFALALSQKSIKSPDIIEKFLLDNFSLKNEKLILEKTEWKVSSEEIENKSGQHKSIPEFCRRHVKPKKQHEIFRLAQVTDAILKHFDLKKVIDIGSGQGHLSRLLALCYNLKVATVEANGCHISDAVQFDKQAFNTLARLKKSTDTSENRKLSVDKLLPHHLKGSVTAQSSQSYLEKVMKHTWDESVDCHQTNFALMGLHACGNLSETILETFVNCDKCKVLLSLGCCYMKLSPKTDEKGYPLSSFVTSLPSHNLSYEAKEMACHALEMYIQRLHENASMLKIHCYRATLEKCIIHHHPNMKHLGLRGVKHAELLEFHEYAAKALSKVPITIPEEFLFSSDIKSCVKRWKDVLVFYTLRLITAPIVESLILIDRLLYLYEQGCTGCIVPIFDSSISPRNLIIISAKS